MTACCDMLDVIELGRMPWRNSVARTRPNEYNMKHPQVLHEKFDNFQTHAATRRNRVAKRAQHSAVVWPELYYSLSNRCSAMELSSGEK